MPTNPGLAAQEKYRIAFRIGGAVLLVIGVVLIVIGVSAFVSMFAHADNPEDAGFDPRFLWAMLGMPVAGTGLGLLKIGFLGASARYVAGETMPVVRDSASYLTNGAGILGVGRDGATEKAGPFCSACGVRNDVGASFCDACGSRLTQP